MHCAVLVTTVIVGSLMAAPVPAREIQPTWGFGLVHGELFRFPGQPYSPDHRDPARRNVPVAWKMFHTRVIDMGLVDPSYAAASTSRRFCDNVEALLPNENERNAFGCNGGVFFQTYPSRAQAEAALASRILDFTGPYDRFEIRVVDVTLGSRAAPVIAFPGRAAAEEAEASAAARAAAEAEAEAERARTTSLNRDVLERDRAIESGNAEAAARYQANLAEHERRAAAHRVEVARAAEARRVYEASLAESARRRAEWEADVAACRAGDRTRCGAAPR